MKRLTKTQVIKMHNLLIQETGGSEGIRDDGLLDSALNAPFQTFDGEDLYKTVPAKAAKLAFFLINNHPFVDGNKRIGILAMLVFLEINGIEVNCTDDELIELGLGLADGTVNNEDLLSWIIEHS
ncbi:type II toxin-antitoxin system death-on-curing family toxin [Mahella sp.]|uniref:type II toxin-antitoxin system death-on-curing family toxin n=1 Tax=Mahella sp. TaxID=2798721 RepID=UPI0024AC41F3|nr:type II toxin-antitoxin system death-on-curing family toxin [Mahella sp.]MBZ4666398.1 type toxin-antitoxin system death-on-curing family toxin [Mahella sp.]MDI3508266.1 death on curing protein [Clostridiales bacterium]MDK2902976.1 death on curing protein [Clostridiales bacterium]